MIDREDGPVKHYRMVCDSCGKQTKRFADEFNFESDAPAGWTEEDKNGDGWDCNHYCPKCNKVIIKDDPKEVISNVGEIQDMSDHDAVYLPIARHSSKKLVVTLDGRKLVITSTTKIKVEQIQE